MELIIRIAKSTAAFFVAFLVYHIAFGCNAFSPDSEGNLQIPLWYPIVGIAISTIASYAVYKQSGRPRKFTARKFNLNTDKDVAARAILKHSQASVSAIQRETGWDHKRAFAALTKLERIGAVSPPNEENMREILIESKK